jgi:hypothetical protein
MKYIIAAKVAVLKVAEDDCEIGFTTKQGTVPKRQPLVYIIKELHISRLAFYYIASKS